jgi:hypothetical protein
VPHRLVYFVIHVQSVAAEFLLVLCSSFLIQLYIETVSFHMCEFPNLLKLAALVVSDHIHTAGMGLIHNIK